MQRVANKYVASLIMLAFVVLIPAHISFAYSYYPGGNSSYTSSSDYQEPSYQLSWCNGTYSYSPCQQQYYNPQQYSYPTSYYSYYDSYSYYNPYQYYSYYQQPTYYGYDYYSNYNYNYNYNGNYNYNYNYNGYY